MKTEKYFESIVSYVKKLNNFQKLWNRIIDFIDGDSPWVNEEDDIVNGTNEGRKFCFYCGGWYPNHLKNCKR